MPTPNPPHPLLRRLAAAVLLRAMSDARAGDVVAAGWLLEDGLELANALGIEKARMAAWCSSIRPSGSRTLNRIYPPRPRRRGPHCSQGGNG